MIPSNIGEQLAQLDQLLGAVLASTKADVEEADAADALLSELRLLENRVRRLRAKAKRTRDYSWLKINTQLRADK